MMWIIGIFVKLIIDICIILVYILGMKMINQYPIKIVSKKTGLSTHVIRAWEKRYKLISPDRTDTNRRIYTEDDINYLKLLKEATSRGFNIGNLINLSYDQLYKLIEDEQKSENLQVRTEEYHKTNTDVAKHFKACYNSIVNLDSRNLDKVLLDASVVLTQPVLFEKLLIPIIYKIGEDWKDGTLKIVHEHFLTAGIRKFLGKIQSTFISDYRLPVMIVTTPSGQLHEMGALLAAMVASSEGWQVIYLGPNLPAEEIAAAVIKKKAIAVSLSVIYPLGDPQLIMDLEKLSWCLPDGTTILVGGRAVSSYRNVLEKIGAQILTDFPHYRHVLAQIVPGNK